ncbi:MAG: LLM class F420-dependent oxidoreductase [Solirubrobacterales bacterium]
MKYGLAIFATDEGPAPAALAKRAEADGFESLWFPEHTHIPASRRSPAPRGGELPRQYHRTLDPFVALTAAACATERLRVGTGICLVVERDPITTAKAVATLDLLSGGRFLFGVGAGWNLEEMENHGTDPKRRFSLLEDRVRAMKALWTEELASYEGRFVRFDPVWAWPKPAQKPHPPILVAGNGPRVLNRVLAFGDEWLPEPEDSLVDRIGELQTRAADEGRDPVPVTVYGASPDGVDVYARAGVHRCVFWLPPRGEHEVEQRVAELASMLGLSASVPT